MFHLNFLSVTLAHIAHEHARGMLSSTGQLVSAEQTKRLGFDPGSLPEVGFEPTHPKITELKSAALDHSAIQANSYPLTGPHWL